MEKSSVPRKRRSTLYTVDSVVTKGKYDESLKAKWNRLSQKLIARFGAEEIASLCQEFDPVCIRDDLSSVMNSDGPNPTTITAVEDTSLRAELEELRARNRELERREEEIVGKTSGEVQNAGPTESDTGILERKSNSEKQALEKRNAELEERNEKQDFLLDFYVTRIEELKTKVGELEDRLAAPSSSKLQRTQYFDKEKEEENSLELLRMQRNQLKEELTRVRSQLDVYELQVDLEIGKKDQAILELETLRIQKAFADAELAELQKWRETFEAEKLELAGLRSQKTIYEVAMKELAVIRSQKEVYEVESIELEELRSRKRMFEEAEAELAELRIQKQMFEAAEKERLELRKRKGMFEDMKPLEKKQFELDELQSLRRQKAILDTTTEELAKLREQEAAYDAVSEELSALRKEREISAKEIADLRKHQRMSKAERNELETLRRQRAAYEAAEKELAGFRGCEMAMQAREQNLVAKQAKLVSNIRYLEMRKSEDDDQHRSELEAARAMIHQTSLDLKAAEEKMLSVCKEKESLQEDKIRWLSVKRELQEENDLLFTEKHNLQKSLNAEIATLQSQIEDAKSKHEEMAREGQVEYYKKELRLQQEKSEADAEIAATLLKETESLREANRACMDRERKLRKEMNMVTKRLDNATMGDLCRICVINSRDTVILPCTHMQSCVRCVKELIQNDKACPTCDTAISGYVPCNTDV